MSQQNQQVNLLVDLISLVLILCQFRSYLINMQLKRVVSITEDGPAENIKVEVQNRNEVAHSQVTLSLMFRTQQRVPNILKASLRNRLPESAKKEENGQNKMKLSKIGTMIKSVIKVSSNKKICEVCEAEIIRPKGKNLEVFMCQEHKQSFCESCLHHYVIYKVKAFEEVHCPHQGCPGMLDMNSKFFNQLPIDVQKAYRKVTQFYLVSKNPNIKMCPKQNCQGFLQTTAENTMVCNSCQKTCCGKCLLGVHSGECDTQELKFFQSNLHYRQCKKCKFIIEKNQGCNHMTCRCGHQFCYVCGQNWDPAHYGNHDQNGRLATQAIHVGQPGNAGQAAMQQDNEGCCEQGCCWFFKLLMKPFLFILLLALMVCIFVSKDLPVIVGMSIICLLAGMFGFSFEIISNMEGLMCVLAVLFFPITMLVGIGKAFIQLFCDMVGNLCGQSREMCCDLSTSICQL